jgi:hypothetical protein
MSRQVKAIVTPEENIEVKAFLETFSRRAQEYLAHGASPGTEVATMNGLIMGVSAMAEALADTIGEFVGEIGDGD